MFKFVTLHACNFRRKQSFTPGNFSKFPTRPMPGNSTLFFLDHLWRSSTPGPGTSTYMLFLHSIPLKSLCIQLPCLDFSGLLDSSFRKSQMKLKFSELLHFHTPHIVIDDSSWKNAAESLTVALTLTLGGYESAIVPNFLKIRVTSAEIRMYV